jgi:hypothetical protein
MRNILIAKPEDGFSEICKTAETRGFLSRLLFAAKFSQTCGNKLPGVGSQLLSFCALPQNVRDACEILSIFLFHFILG